MKLLAELKKIHPCIKDVRGKGLMIGVEFDRDIPLMAKDGLKKGILLNVIKNHILRIAPPLIITTKEIDLAVEKIDNILKDKGM